MAFLICLYCIDRQPFYIVFVMCLYYLVFRVVYYESNAPNLLFTVLFIPYRY